MRKYKYTGGEDQQWIFTLILHAGDHDLVPENSAIEKHVGDLRRLLPIKRGDREVAFHERDGDSVAAWLRLLIAQAEGVELSVAELPPAFRSTP